MKQETPRARQSSVSLIRPWLPAESAKTTSSGGSKRRLCGGHFRCKVSMPSWTSACQAALSYALIRQRSRLTTTANPFVGIPDPTFTGWYVEGSWFFGGHKTYEKVGRWGRPKIDNPMFHDSGGWGALQLVGKYDVLDQSDDASFDRGVNPVSSSFTGACANTRLFPGLSAGSTSSGGSPQAPTLVAESVALCGEMKTWVVGVNWWMTEYMRLMFQYSESELSGYPQTTISTNSAGVSVQNGGATVAGFDGATIRGFGMRMHVDW